MRDMANAKAEPDQDFEMFLYRNVDYLDELNRESLPPKRPSAPTTPMTPSSAK